MSSEEIARPMEDEFALVSKIHVARNEMIARGFQVDSIMLGQNEICLFKSFIANTTNVPFEGRISTHSLEQIYYTKKYMGLTIIEHQDVSYFGVVIRY